MISETCRLSSGEESTGINGVICGFICPMLATNNVNPERRKPKHANVKSGVADTRLST